MYFCIYVPQNRELPVAKTSVKDGSAIRAKGRTLRPISKQPLDSDCSDDNYDPDEYGDSRVKSRENEMKRRSSRQSAQEAVKRLKRNFAAPSGDEDDK